MIIMRTFIAIDLPENIKKSFVEIQKQIDNQAKLSRARDFHITLKFLGESNEQRISLIKEKLSKIKFNKFETKLSEIGFFPSEKYIKVIWVGINPEKETIELQKQIDKALSEFPSDYRFHPHMTLARVKFVKDKIKFLRDVKKIKIKPLEFEVTNFKLKKSTLTPEGPIYEDLGVFG